MEYYNSTQDLIVKAALHDGISTTISPKEGLHEVLEIVFTKDNYRSGVCIDTRFSNEEQTLFGLKHALFGLLRSPYDEIALRRDKYEASF